MSIFKFGFFHSFIPCKGFKENDQKVYKGIKNIKSSYL
jgi:hypothetical protein